MAWETAWIQSFSHSPNWLHQVREGSYFGDSHLQIAIRRVPVCNQVVFTHDSDDHLIGVYIAIRPCLRRGADVQRSAGRGPTTAAKLSCFPSREP